MQWINAAASCERKLDFQFLTWVSSSIWCLITIGLISIRFKGIIQPHIRYTSTKIYANWMSASSWHLCLNGHYFRVHWLADKQTPWPILFREWFCKSAANQHKICTRLRQRFKILAPRITPETVKFHSMKLTMMLLNFEKLRFSPLDLGA